MTGKSGGGAEMRDMGSGGTIARAAGSGGAIARLAGEVLRGKKYAHVSRAAVERVCAESLLKYGKHKDAAKAAKKELHIIYGAYMQEGCHERAEALIRSRSSCAAHGHTEALVRGRTITPDILNDRELARALMSLHASTRERLGREEEIYGYVSGFVRPEDTLADIGCGYNPFALPFYAARPKHYIAYDICDRTAALLRTYFATAAAGGGFPGAGGGGFPGASGDGSPGAAGTARGVAGTARALDAVAETPECGADIVLMLKIFPLLERQRKGRAFELLSQMGCRVAVVSFPTKSASGREKGMEAFYTDVFTRGLPAGLSAEKSVFGGEMFFAVQRR